MRLHVCGAGAGLYICVLFVRSCGAQNGRYFVYICRVCKAPGVLVGRVCRGNFLRKIGSE